MKYLKVKVQHMQPLVKQGCVSMATLQWLIWSGWINGDLYLVVLSRFNYLVDLVINIIYYAEFRSEHVAKVQGLVIHPLRDSDGITLHFSNTIQTRTPKKFPNFLRAEIYLHTPGKHPGACGTRMFTPYSDANHWIQSNSISLNVN